MHHCIQAAGSAVEHDSGPAKCSCMLPCVSDEAEWRGYQIQSGREAMDLVYLFQAGTSGRRADGRDVFKWASGTL